MKRVLYIQYTNPAAYPPLGHSARQLADNGWQVYFLGVRALSGADAIHFAPHPNIHVKYLPACAPGVRQKFHFVWYALTALGYAVKWRPHWVYASDDLSAPTAFILTFFPSMRVIYHEHDSPTNTSNGSPFMRLCYAARKLLAQRCALNILPNEQRAQRFAEDTLTTKNITTVWNCPAREEAQIKPLARERDTLWVLYHGTIVPQRLPRALLHALQLLPEQIKLRVIGYETSGNKGYVSRFRDTAAQLGVADRVEFHDAMGREDLFTWARRSDVGLAFMPPGSTDVNMRFMIGASNKAFDYLACGLPLLVSDLADWRTMFVEHGYGLMCDPTNKESIAQSLLWFWEHREEVERMGERGRQRILDVWNYEIQFAGVLEKMNDECAGALVRIGAQHSTSE